MEISCPQNGIGVESQKSHPANTTLHCTADISKVPGQNGKTEVDANNLLSAASDKGGVLPTLLAAFPGPTCQAGVAWTAFVLATHGEKRRLRKL